MSMNFQLLYAIAGQAYHCFVLCVLLAVLLWTRSELIVWWLFELFQTFTFYMWIVLCTLVVTWGAPRRVVLMFFLSWGVSALFGYMSKDSYTRDVITACANQTGQALVRFFIPMLIT